jgi:putative ABC transport system permease protein
VITITVNTIWAHKRRLAATTLGVVLGVAFLAGTLLLGDTLRANFSQLFTQADATTDVVVRSATAIGSGATAPRTGIDAALLQRVRAVNGVAEAQPYLEGYAKLIGKDGTAIGGSGPPTTAANWIADPRLNPYHLVQGHAPQADDQVVINSGAASSGKLSVGSTATMLVPQPLRVHVVGIAKFGSADGFGSGTFAGLTLHAARADLTRNPGQISQIMVRAAPGVTPGQLARRLQASLPGSVQAITGTQIAAADNADINSGFLGFLRTALTVFAVIALLVAAFSIYNTFCILAAQRSRESALLRALGASRRQVIGASIAETLVVGVFGSIAGWAAGIGIAAGLKGVFDAFGFALPAGGLVFRASSALLAIGTGVLVTVLAGVLPAVRAARIPPIAALRDLAAESPVLPRRRLVAGSVVIAAGAALAIGGATAHTAVLAGLGALLLVAGMVVLGPFAARLAAGALGRPVAALRGITGSLARQNARRNPRRTAATATALMVGVAVVSLFAVIGASLKASAGQGVDRTLTADMVVDTPGYGGASGNAGLSPQVAGELARLPGVRVAAPIAVGNALLNGQSQRISAADPATIGSVLDLDVVRGSLGPDTLAVSGTAAADQHWQLGSVVPITYPDGATARLRVGAIYDNTQLAGDYLLGAAAWTAHTRQPLDAEVLLKLRPGAGLAATKAAAGAVADRYGTVRVQDRAEFRASTVSGVNTILGLIYVMLALAILIALMGIANTLSLSIHERTRELGLLRAVGQSRGQTRAMVRWESLIIAVFGTVGGVLLGTFLGWAIVSASASTALAAFSAPALQLVIFLVVGAAAGVLAGLRPARRAARRPVLAALVAE